MGVPVDMCVPWTVSSLSWGWASSGCCQGEPLDSPFSVEFSFNLVIVEVTEYWIQILSSW